MQKLLLLLLIVAAPAAAQNIDLATVPPRQQVQLTIYNSEDLTLVRETRRLSFNRGSNPLQFSWANTLIDPTSVELRFPNAGDRLEVLDTTFPHARPQLLVWNVHSDADLEAEIEISYFTSGISWAADYLAIADRGEQTLRLDGYVRVDNQSGEDYADAEIRLVVGTINLVEKIAELARMPVAELDRLGQGQRQELRSRAMRRSLAEAELQLAADAAMPQPKTVAKQSLSDYFIYTIEGTETVPNGWSKRLRSFSAGEVPLTVRYRYRPQQYGDQLVRLYTLRNDAEAGLGETPIPDGEVRVFRANGRGGLSYLAAQTVPYVPIGDLIELNLGPDPEVVFELIKLRVFRDNVWLQLHGRQVYHSLDRDGLRVDPDSRVAGWDEHALYSQRIRNYSGRQIEVEVRRSYDGDVLFRSSFAARLHDYRTVEYRARVAAGARAELLHQVTRREGYNRQQDRVEVQRETVGEG